MSEPAAAVVLPCFNEEETLLSTCRSLGFGMGEAEHGAETHLFIVDNGSTDGTLAVAQEIQENSPPGTVTIVREEERGYVPPRHTGNNSVQVFAATNNLDPSEILILQADADTLYGREYIGAMRSAAKALGPNTLLEGVAEFPPGFQNSFPEYVELCAEIDTRVDSLLGLPESNELICTDAVCGYRLSDYLAWGGHLREYTARGDEIHAETTRLYMRSLPRGGRKVRVPGALAHPSERKAVLRPLEELATAGFPREPSWRISWANQHGGTATLEELRALRSDPEILDAIKIRERHLVALFGVLPLHVARALGSGLSPSVKPVLREIAASLPERDAGTLYRSPGVFLTDVLDLTDQRASSLASVLREAQSNGAQRDQVSNAG